MFGFRKRRASTDQAASPSHPSRPILAQHEAICRACGRTVTETGMRANFRVVSQDADTGQRWIDACPACRLRPRQ